MKPQITTHYSEGRPSVTRDMTDEEIATLPTETFPDEIPTPDSSADAG